MQQRFRRGAISIGPGKCSGCDRIMHHGETYLSIDEKPSDKLKEETVFIDDIECSECGNRLENGDELLLDNTKGLLKSAVVPIRNVTRNFEFAASHRLTTRQIKSLFE